MSAGLTIRSKSSALIAPESRAASRRRPSGIQLGSGRPRPWGVEDSGWQAWFGGRVVDGLCEVLDEYLEEHKHGEPAVPGCIRWFDSRAVEDRLLKMRACCVVIDKGSWLPGRLVKADFGVSEHLPQRIAVGDAPRRRRRKVDRSPTLRSPSMSWGLCEFSAGGSGKGSRSFTPRCLFSALHGFQ
jgi:hypothetical protein